MAWLSDYWLFLKLDLLMSRALFPLLAMIQAVLSIGLILGFGYFVPGITQTQALFLTIGAAGQAIVTVGLVMLPQKLSQQRVLGHLDYFLTLPVHREAFLLAQVSFVALGALPGVTFAVAFGAWHYDLPLDLSPLVLVAVPLAILSLAGVGVALAILSPYQQLTNAATQLIIFYVLLFAPVLIPREQLPALLQDVSVVMPPTYAVDALRATLSDLPGTNLEQSLLVMAVFAAASIGVSALAVRRRG